MRRRTRLFPEKIQQDYDWAFANYAKIAKRYPNQWVAFSNRRILAAGPKIKDLLEKAGRQGSHLPHLFFESGIHVYDYQP